MEEGSFQVLGQFSFVSMVLRTSAKKKSGPGPWIALCWCQCFNLLNLLCWCPNLPIGFRCAVFCLSVYLRLPSAGTQHNTYFKTNKVTIQGGTTLESSYWNYLPLSFHVISRYFKKQLRLFSTSSQLHLFGCGRLCTLAQLFYDSSGDHHSSRVTSCEPVVGGLNSIHLQKQMLEMHLKKVHNYRKNGDHHPKQDWKYQSK